MLDLAISCAKNAVDSGALCRVCRVIQTNACARAHARGLNGATLHTLHTLHRYGRQHFTELAGRQRTPTRKKSLRSSKTATASFSKHEEVERRRAQRAPRNVELEAS